MAIVRLLGHDIAYSASPAMHTAAFTILGLDHRYELADVSAEDLPGAIEALRRDGTLGANVTVPHKAAAARLVDDLDATAERAGAVNTIAVDNGRLLGSNTDVPAIADEIRLLNGAPGKAVILGAGGAARAVELALLELGATDAVMVTRSQRMTLPSLLGDADLLVNATPVGANADESPIDPDLLHRGLAVLDLVYRPSPTRLVHDARARGLNARAGGGVLLGQGWRSLETWLSTVVSDDVKRAMADALSADLGAGADV